MKAFCPSSVEGSARGALAFSQARTSSRKAFAESRSSKSSPPTLSHCRNHVVSDQLQRFAVVEQEVLEHDEVDPQRRIPVDLIGDLVGGADRAGLADLRHNFVGVEAF